MGSPPRSRKPGGCPSSWGSAATIPRRIRFGIDLPGRIAAEVGDDLVEAMAYPEFDTPMYEPLKDISAELFLPNLNLIEQNSITLLETNQKFIEAYMVGLNHEFARELLWREYPTDQRGSYFRQFWDVRGMYDPAQPDADTLKEKLRDIPPLHTWPRRSLLGQHDNRESQSGDADGRTHRAGLRGRPSASATGRLVATSILG